MRHLEKAFVILKRGRAPGTAKQARIKAQSISLSQHRKSVPITLPKEPWAKEAAK